MSHIKHKRASKMLKVSGCTTTQKNKQKEKTMAKYKQTSVIDFIPDHHTFIDTHINYKTVTVDLGTMDFLFFEFS